MAGDLLSLRQHVASLEVENRHLRRSLASQEELGHALLADADLDVMTREELMDRLGAGGNHTVPWPGAKDVAWALAATLKCKLVASTAEMRRLKDRVQQLQNELIRKNDREKDLVLLQRTHQQQQATLRRCQEKVAKTKGLEETVRQQEKVSWGTRGWGEKDRLRGMRVCGADRTLWPIPPLHERYLIPGPWWLGRCGGHRSLALSW
ncbi:hypothetical protein QYF61_006109 [Mycteria americana]|uniref:Uncharacterized protein n=1 Tax=Mycteria americana TaxID=33587 RepID=A0AAN7N667_MYCAM|nr:hypothetical protein QYF61_006109 [Mycteria americana]